MGMASGTGKTFGASDFFPSLKKLGQQARRSPAQLRAVMRGILHGEG